VLAGLVLLALQLARACTGVVDETRARTCRSIVPAVEAQGAAIRILRTGRGATSDTIRVDYEASRDGMTRQRRLDCRFGPDPAQPDRDILTGVRTWRGEITGASLYFLRRFYLDSRENPPDDPGMIPARPADLPQIPRPLAFLAQVVLSALPGAAILALTASAYAMIHGLIGRVVFGFGELAALGGIATVIAMLAMGGVSGAGLAAGLVAAVAVGFAHGLAGGRTIVGPLSRRGRLSTLVGSVGLMIALSEYLRLAQGSTLRFVQPVLAHPVPVAAGGDFIVTLTPMGLLAFGLALVAGAALAAMMRLSAFGRAWRATADDPHAAALCGVDSRRILSVSTGIAGGLAGLAGFVATAHYGAFGFSDGLPLGLKALVAAVLGGVGSIPAAFAGGIVLGLSEALWSAYLPLGTRDVAIYGLIAAFLALRPQGLFAGEEVSRGTDRG
jgi:branched-subunit amino acid ABC-type transport system permease component